jgi:quercetin dioxygenase-like cupin family protein
VAYTLLRDGDPGIESINGVFFKLRRALGTTAFGINEVRVPPGGSGREHDEAETGHEEVYVVLAGSGRAKLEGEEQELKQWDALRIPPQVTRGFAAGPDGMELLVIGFGEAGDVEMLQGYFEET